MALPYTLATATTEVRRILREPVANIHADSELQASINRGARIISAITLCNPEVEQITLAENQFKYTLSSKKFLKIEEAVFDYEKVNGGPIGLQRISFRGIGHVSPGTAAVPRFYSVWGNGGNDYFKNIFIWPVYSVPISMDKVTIMGYTQAANFGTNGENIPAYLHYPCINYALACASAKEGKHTLAHLYMSKFISDANFYRREIYDYRKSVDSKDLFKIPDLTRMAEQG